MKPDPRPHSVPTPSPNLAAILDDPQRHVSLDRDRMHDAIAAFPDHLMSGVDLARGIDWSMTQPTTPAGIAICGMGGSAIGGDLARLYWEHDAPMPLAVVRSYTLPAFINSHWFIIGSSYSGNTVESISAVNEARRRRCRNVLVLASGGQLASMASENRWKSIVLPPGMMPRAALGYSFGAVLYTLAQWGVTGNDPRVVTKDIVERVTATAASLKQNGTAWTKDVHGADNLAKQIAGQIGMRAVVVLGATGSTDTLAVRWKNQLCENGKALAFATALPESNHHEIIGFDMLDPDADSLCFITLQSPDDHPEIERQRAALCKQLMMRGHHVIEVKAEGDDRLARMLYLVHLGDFVSYHVAILRGQDPTPIAAIDRLKAALA